MKEYAVVKSTVGKYAKVEIDKKDECSKCGMCLFPKNAKSISVNAENPVGAKAGDKVFIETKPKVKSLSILLVFLVPLLLIIACALIGYFAFNSELAIVFSSIISVALWYLLLAVIDKKIGKTTSMYAVVTQIVRGGENSSEEVKGEQEQNV